MTDRYYVRPDRAGFSVYDQWTGEVPVIAMARQNGLSREDAEHTAALLNTRVRRRTADANAIARPPQAGTR